MGPAFLGRQWDVRAKYEGIADDGTVAYPIVLSWRPHGYRSASASRNTRVFSLSGSVDPPYTSSCRFPLLGWDRTIRSDTVGL